MVKELKSIQKSIRMTKNTFNYVNKFKGNGFNEKLETMIYKLQREQAELDEAVKLKEDRLKILEAQIYEKSNVLIKLKEAEYYIEKLVKVSKS